MGVLRSTEEVEGNTMLDTKPCTLYIKIMLPSSHKEQQWFTGTSHIRASLLGSDVTSCGGGLHRGRVE